MKHLFLINPAAGKRGSTDALCRQIRETFAGLGLDYEVFLAAAPGLSQRFAASIPLDTADYAGTEVILGNPPPAALRHAPALR